jgi:uncharacterized protein involved in exopolysaccharide biosynthesis
MQPQNNSEQIEFQPSGIPAASIADYFHVLSKRRKLIGYVTGGGFALSIFISLLMPRMYMATARILPPQETGSSFASLLSKNESPLSGLADKLFSQQTPAELYVGIMKSRTVADALDQKFKLKELYNLKYIEDVHAKLKDRSDIRVSPKDQIISISVKDRDPHRAADMANAYVDELDQINRRLNITEGQRKRAFLEGRLKEVASNLEKAENALKDFQEQNHLVAIDEQAKAEIKAAAEIKAEIIAAQTELTVFRQFGTERQNEAVMLKAKVEELQNYLSLIENGMGENKSPSKLFNYTEDSSLYVPLGRLPELGMKLAHLTREAKTQEKVFELLTAQYEIAHIEEAKDVNTVQVLDQALAPEKKYSPKRIFIVLDSTFLSFVGIILAIIMHWMLTAREDQP